MKKVLLVLAVIAALSAFGLNMLSRKGPELLRDAIEKALNKKVMIGAIDYRFPNHFELKDFNIREKAPFEDEISFAVNEVRLKVSPLSFSKRSLILDKIHVEDAEITIRQYHGRLVHSLSEAVKGAGRAEPEAGTPAAAAPGKSLPLEIHRFSIRNSRFRFMDYDVASSGFVIALEDIRADLKNIELPLSLRPTIYSIEARLPQGRDQRVGEFKISGATVFQNLETDSNFSLKGVFIPYFSPYYGQVTGAGVENGYLDSRANLRIQQGELVLNVDSEISELVFRNYEAGEQLFGLRADEILSFLKDSAGRLHFQIVVRWNIRDRSVKLKDVIRKSIERSLKNTVLSNVGNILENTMKKIDEGSLERSKDDVGDTLKRLKELFR